MKLSYIIFLSNNQNSTQSDFDNFDVGFTLEQRIQNYEAKDSGWRFDELNSMTKYVFKTTELTGSKNVKLTLKNSALLNNENVDKYCSFLWILTNLHPSQNSQPNRVSSLDKILMNWILEDYILQIDLNVVMFINFEH